MQKDAVYSLTQNMSKVVVFFIFFRISLVEIIFLLIYNMILGWFSTTLPFKGGTAFAAHYDTIIQAWN